MLSQIRGALDTSSHPEKATQWAVCCTAFFGFFRLGELLIDSSMAFNQSIHLAWGDIAVDNQCNPKMIWLHLKQSKPDQMGNGANIVLGKTGLDLCPITAILGYIVIQGSQPGPFFMDSKGKPLTKSGFVTELRKILTTLGFPYHQYVGHSFCIGAATSAALVGVEDFTIQLFGQWHSTAFPHCIRTPHKQLAALSHTLAAHGTAQTQSAD